MLEMVYHIPLEDQEEITWLLLHQFNSEHCDLKSWTHLQMSYRFIVGLFTERQPLYKKGGVASLFLERRIKKVIATGEFQGYFQIPINRLIKSTGASWD